MPIVTFNTLNLIQSRYCRRRRRCCCYYYYYY